MNTNELRDAISFLQVELPHGFWPGLQMDQSIRNPGVNESEWNAYAWNPPTALAHLSMDPDASAKPPWAELTGAHAQLQEVGDRDAILALLTARGEPGSSNPPVTRRDWHFHPWQGRGEKPGWDDISTAAVAATLEAARAEAETALRRECRHRITEAYGEGSVEDEILLRLRGGHTADQDTERDRLRGRHTVLFAYIEHPERTLDELTAFDVTDDAHWRAEGDG